jgi:hypothetical protein
MRLIEKIWRLAFTEIGINIPSRIPVVVADNVSDYLFTHHRDKGRFKIPDVTELPCIKPPFDSMWIDINATYGAEAPPKIGLLISKMKDLNTETTAYKFDVFFQNNNGIGCTGTIAVSLNNEGKTLEIKVGNFRTKEAEAASLWFHYVACFAISLMHCKNVVLTERKNPAWFRGNPRRPRLEKWQVIEVGSINTRSKSEPADSGRETSLHICRGHFRTYTAEKPLFGSYTGTVWVPAHARGSADVGVVHSSYEVKK